MKKIVLFGFVGAFVLFAGTGVYWLSRSYLTSHSSRSTSCELRGTHYQVNITSGGLDASNVIAKRCDTLIITNHDDILRLIAFGPHDQHQAYDGVGERALGRGQSLTITLNQTGSFTFHDHLHDRLIGSFAVTD